MLNFLRKIFLMRAKFREIEFYEKEDSRHGTTIRSVEVEEATPIPHRDSESDLPFSKSILLTQGSQEPQLGKSICASIPHCCLEVEGEAFMIATHDDNEPSTYHKANSSLAYKKWMDAILSEMESKKFNHVWDLVDLPLGQKTIRNK